ncbi:phosphate acyltransferase PlsX [Sulfoacidibacillus thermotolerans]|uniref:Phosphate acyltransferase n=1 Tax=Sulfoacidibacillus thermotolerans TaxID=1765684 RepID=A0A2U3D7V4_SULT2|nr:phosphate acyltransferase PlsX [Sulfoacidibacillus thermotolerans]PWI57349.1 phosphate acyltransferase [Sulfoacidibacillus thermotolerans]
MRVAIDAMGGDHAPKAPVLGTIEAARKLKDAEFVLVGKESEIRLYAHDLPDNVKIMHASDVIAPHAEPVKSVRRQKDSSLVVCTSLVRDGQADAMVSAGNTGAFMVAGLFVVGRMTGIERPALAAMLPTFKGKGVLLLDAGANTDSSPKNLVQWAQMGQAYMRLTHQMAKPRVGLLNIGSEPGKGNELCKTAYGMLENTCTDFIGNVEARELLNGVCDVVVCDGFVGNVLVKFYEGAGIGLLDSLKQLFLATPLTKLAALSMRSGLKAFRSRFDYAEYGGGPFLGVRGVLVKAHGSSSSRAFEMAIRHAYKMQSGGLIQDLERSLQG